MSLDWGRKPEILDRFSSTLSKSYWTDGSSENKNSQNFPAALFPMDFAIVYGELDFLASVRDQPGSYCSLMSRHSLLQPQIKSSQQTQTDLRSVCQVFISLFLWSTVRFTLKQSEQLPPGVTKVRRTAAGVYVVKLFTSQLRNCQDSTELM